MTESYFDSVLCLQLGSRPLPPPKGRGFKKFDTPVDGCVSVAASHLWTGETRKGELRLKLKPAFSAFVGFYVFEGFAFGVGAEVKLFDIFVFAQLVRGAVQCYLALLHHIAAPGDS